MSRFPDGPQVPLPRGDVTEGVVRIGDTVRRPHQDTSPFVAGYLQHLASVGFDGAPRYLGRDGAGRDVLTFIEGDVSPDPVADWAAAEDILPGVGRLLRRLHDASEGWVPAVPPPITPGRPQPNLPPNEVRLVSHRDATPQNVVFRGGAAVALVDFDLAGITTRSIDLANTAMHWIPLADPADRAAAFAGRDDARRIRRLLDGYGTDMITVGHLLDACSMRFAGSYEIMRWAAEHQGGGWARMWDEGVGEVIRRRVAWFAGVRDQLAAALTADPAG